jgi:hypothetical protein
MYGGIDARQILLKRVTVRRPYLTTGVHDTIDKDLGMVPGKVILTTSKGDMDMTLSMLAKLLARGSLVEWPGDKARKTRAAFMYPKTFDKIDAFKNLVEIHVDISGARSMIDVTYRKIENGNDQVDAINEFRDFDMIMVFFIDFFYPETAGIVSFMNLVNSMKGGKIVVANRFDKRKKSVSDHADILVDVVATRFMSPEDYKRAARPGSRIVSGKVVITAGEIDMGCKVIPPVDDIIFSNSNYMEKKAREGLGPAVIP